MTLRPFQPLEALVHNKKRFLDAAPQGARNTRKTDVDDTHAARGTELARTGTTTVHNGSRQKQNRMPINQSNKQRCVGRENSV